MHTLTARGAHYYPREYADVRSRLLLLLLHALRSDPVPLIQSPAGLSQACLSLLSKPSRPLRALFSHRSCRPSPKPIGNPADCERIRPRYILGVASTAMPAPICFILVGLSWSIYRLLASTDN